MSKTYTINVTQRDINLGERHNCTKCPIARAAKRVMRDIAPSVEVGVGSITAWKSYTQLVKSFRLPAAAQQFIRDFDTCLPVEPLRFTVTADEN